MTWIPLRRTAAVLARPWHSTPTASYTTRSNGAAFLSSLEFLAPSPSQPRPTQPSATNSQRLQSPLQSGNREFLKNTTSLWDDDALFGVNKGSGSIPGKATVKRTSLNGINNSSSRGEKRPGLDRHRRDEEIDSQWIQYITPEGQRSEKQLRHVLRSFDRSQYFLVEVDPNARPPICKLFSKKELYNKAKAAKQAKKANELTVKELQLNWGTDNHDLAHKLAKFRGFLEKGHRLEIQINGRRGKNTTPREREEVLERVKAEFEPVSKYVRQPEWVKDTTVTLLLQGTPKTTESAKK
ncbi:hypothetical protein EDD11_009926 [Mortierella claussenii]|nr:hypothetical protein EDD11_009926 [Mortierella claussenii]